MKPLEEKNNLIGWLKEEGVYELYLINLDEDEEVGAVIGSAFVWKDTPEGALFWYKLFRKYNEGVE